MRGMNHIVEGPAEVIQTTADCHRPRWVGRSVPERADILGHGSGLPDACVGRGGPDGRVERIDPERGDARWVGLDVEHLAGSAEGFELAQPARWREFLDYANEGVWHIWLGFDHLLFLLSLLLPAVLVRTDGHWEAVRAFRPAFWDVFKIVTAFTWRTRSRSPSRPWAW